ncbi:MAG: hypothetical protein Q8R57_12430 [Bacteroidota bacterium]|nr:hypothetical protein [Bacteroidota bacterium]
MPNFKPSLSSLIPFDELPESFSQLEQAQELFNKLYYSNLNVNFSTQGDACFYSMDLSITQSQELALSVPGVDGMRVLLNPTIAGGGFPFTLNTQIGILKYIKDFNISSFPKSVPAFFDILLTISCNHRGAIGNAVENNGADKWLILHGGDDKHNVDRVAILPGINKSVPLPCQTVLPKTIDALKAITNFLGHNLFRNGNLKYDFTKYRYFKNPNLTNNIYDRIYSKSLNACFENFNEELNAL